MAKFAVLLISIFLTACATHQSRISPARTALIDGNCSKALPLLEEFSQKKNDDQLLYLMEYGSALQICQDYKKSNEAFLQADKLSDEFDYYSASRILGATLLNEEMIQYKGDTFEKLFINASAALNYIELGLFDDAMVEVRRINEKYNKLSAENKNSFELNSFSQYLSALIWEADRKYDDACISYKSAYRLDKVYRTVALDALRACWRAKRVLEFNDLVKEVQPTDSELTVVKQKNKNEVVVIYLQGLGPRKAPRPRSVYPYLLPTYNRVKRLRIEYQNEAVETEALSTKPVYSVEKAAIATLEADYGALMGRRIGARVAKEVMADQIRQKDKALGEVAWLVMVASERADLRNWSLLPESVQVLRFNPLKMSKVKVTGLGDYGAETEKFDDIDLSVHPAKKIYIVRSIR